MFLSGLIPKPMCADDDYKLLEFGIGFTNIVERTTRGSGNLSRKEIVAGVFSTTFTISLRNHRDGMMMKLNFQKKSNWNAR